MMYVSGAYRISGTGPLMETQHIATFDVASLADYLERVISSSNAMDVPLVTWAIGSEPDRWRLCPIAGRGPGFLFAFANREDLDVRFEVLRESPEEGRPSDVASQS